MRTGSQIQKEAEAESVKCLGEVSKDFIIGYLSSWIAITENGGIYKKGFSDGYDAGFTCAEIACNCNITEAQNQYDQEPTAPENGIHTSAGVPGPSFEPIAGIDFKTGVDGLFDSIKVICEDYNEKIRKEKP